MTETEWNPPDSAEEMVDRMIRANGRTNIALHTVAGWRVYQCSCDDPECEGWVFTDSKFVEWARENKLTNFFPGTKGVAETAEGFDPTPVIARLARMSIG